MTRAGWILATMLLVGGTAAAETVRIEAAADATIIEDPDGALANGSGPAFFVGRINQDFGSVRRAVVRFDVAARIPRRAVIERVALELHLNPSNPEPRTILLHRVLAAWSEGPASSAGGFGAPSEPGDVTWLHTYWDSEFWVHGGGQFVGSPSARATIAATGDYVFEGPRLAGDVRAWIAAPHRDFGWILIGDETTRQTAKGFASREEPDPTLRPVLVVTYRVQGRP